MNSDRVDEIAALREQKKLDRQAEIEAREAKEAEEAKSPAAFGAFLTNWVDQSSGALASTPIWNGSWIVGFRSHR